MSTEEQQGSALEAGQRHTLLEAVSVSISSTSDAEERRRAFTTVFFGLSLTFWAFAFAVIYVVMESVRCALITVVTGVSLLVVVLLLKVSRPAQLAGNLIAAIVLAALLSLSLFSGGLMAPAMIWLPAVPIIAILLGGWRPGLLWLLATLASAVVIFFLHKAGVLRSDFKGESVELLYILGLLGIITCTTLLCFIFDFNARALRRQLEVARIVAEQASRAKSEFVAHMSHEIRTPMNGVIGMLELLGNTEVTKQQQEYIHLAKQSADSLLRILNDILDFSKIEAGKLELESISFQLRDVIGDTLQALEVKAAEKKLELACHILADVPDELVGDPGRLRQIIVNLVGNALKFTRQGEVVVRVSNESVTDSRANLHFSFCDTGVGIPKEKQKRIFEAFGQADSSTTRQFGGTGLGLNISRQLIEMMGGRLGLESEEGKGTAFHFTASFARQAEASGRPAASPASLAGMSVLVVDDNATNRFILNELLSYWGMQATCVDGARAALEALDDRSSDGEPFRLVLLDMMMPEVDGLMLAEQISSDPRYGDIPLIMLSSSSGDAHTDRCEALGIVAQLRKPIKQSELFNEIIHGLDRTKAQPRRETRQKVLPAVRPLRILLAEDGLINQKVAMGLLEAQGHTVTIAENGAKAVRAVEREAFDLVLMDVEMPEMDGLEATSAIRKREQAGQTQHRIPIVAMTAHAIKGERERFLAAGMDAHVPKPIDPPQLYQVIAQLTSAAETGNEKKLPLQGSDTQPDSADIMSSAHIESELEGVIDVDCARGRILGGDDALRHVAQLLRDEAPRLFQSIQQALADGDVQGLRRAAHTLRGSAGVFAARSVVETAQRLEMLAAEGQPDADESQAVVEQLGLEVQKLTAALSALMQRSSFSDSV